MLKKGLRVTKSVKKNKFDEAWGELEVKFYFQRCLKNFLLSFTSSLRARNFKNSLSYAKIYFYLLKTCPRSNFKCFQYQILTSVKRLEK